MIWINNGQRLRNPIHSRQVMVGNDQIHSGAPRRFRGRECADARVHADNQPYPVRRRPLDYLIPHAVAFADAMRHMKISRPPAKLNRSFQNHDRGRAVHVVVAVNKNFLFPLQRPFQPIQRRFHPAHPQRIMKVGKRRRKKTSGRFRFIQPAANQQIGQHRHGGIRNFKFGITQ